MKINGMKVVNAKKSITIKISANDVKRGRKKNPYGCAAAIACRRQLRATDARVHVGRTYVRFNGHWERYLTSLALRSEVVAFDRGGRFAPGEYLLHKMQPSKRKGKRQGSNKPHKYASKRRKYHTLSGVRPMGLSA